MTVFFSQLINGLSLGSIYALIALGYSMVYGIILLLNFAHGDIIMVGAYMSWFVMNQLGLGPVTAVCLHPAAQRAPHLAADHGHRRLLLLGVHRRAHHGVRCQGHPGLFRPQDLLCR